LIKKLEDKLLQLEKKQTFIKSVIETMPVSLLVVNPDATIKAVNPRTCELLGYKEKELVGKSVETVLNHTVVADTILNGVGLEKIVELERFNKITMGREMRILELKEEVARLKGEKVPAPPIPKVKPITPTAKKTKKTKPKPKPKPKP